MPWDLVSRLGDPDGFAIDLKLLANDTFLPPALFLPNHSLTPLLDYLSAIDGAPSVDGFTDPSGLVAAGDLAGNVYPTLDNIRHQYILPETSQAALVKVVDGNALIINGDRDGAVYSPETFGLNDYENLILPDLIMLAGDTWSLSQNVGYKVLNGDSEGKVIVGNGGKNTLTGGDGNDFIFGGGDVDTLKGGKGDDFLYGGRYSDISLNAFVANPPITSTQVDLLKTYTEGWRSDDASYLIGGAGKDTMWGSSGDNDYFYVDVNMNGGNAGNSNNVDVIEHFHVANLVSDPWTEDYLIFSADQLGGNIKTSLASWGWSETDVHGVKAYYLENSDKNFLMVSGMDRYVAKLDATKGYDPLFILDVLTDNLYFDQDGIRTVNDYVLVAHLAHSENSLLDLDADQILIVQSFDLV